MMKWKQGFSRTIEGRDGNVYQLPLAEYQYLGDGEDQSVILGLAKDRSPGGAGVARSLGH